jgi:hypothetical protein
MTAVKKAPDFIKFVESLSLLDEEDEKLYQETFEAIMGEVQSKSVLDTLAVKDFVDKLFEERRYKDAIVDLIEGAQNRVLLVEKDEQGLAAIEIFLPSLQKLDRMVNSSQTGRRAILKELRQNSVPFRPDGKPAKKDEKN